MAILASLRRINLFSSLPSNPPPNNPISSSSSSSSPPKPPIPIPKYSPPVKKSKNRLQKNNPPPKNPALKLPHRRTHYYKPVRDGVISSEGDRSVVVGENGVSYRLPGAPFEFQYSYSETPNVKPLAIREPAFFPFAPPTMNRPWTGKAPLKKKKKKIPLFDTGSSPSNGGAKTVEMPVSFPFGNYPEKERSREEVLGEPLSRWEIKTLVKPYLTDNRQVNLGRDGLTHNMLELIHTHWKRRPICKVRCKGVPTVDMKNICRHLEERTGGKIVYRVGGVVYLFRGRNYDPRKRPRYPVMLWKPAAPVYPKLIQEAPEGLTKAEADEFREKGKTLLPICKLAKNGVYITLVSDVRAAFEGSQLVKIDCKGLDASDYKKLGAKLKELVPCVLLSFDDEQILMWRGQNWKSRYPERPSFSSMVGISFADGSEDSGMSDDYNPDAKIVKSSPKMMSLWKRAIDSSKAILLDEINVGPDALLRKVEEFESISKSTEHSYPVSVLPSGHGASNSVAAFEDRRCPGENSGESEEDAYRDAEYEDDEDENEEFYESDSFDDIDNSVSLGSLPVDLIAEASLKNEFKKY